MSEGPQVRRRTEWLHRQLEGRKVIRCQSPRSDINAELIEGELVERAFCKGKHIFIEFRNGRFLHNHLLMRGRWRKVEGQQLFLPDGAWLSLYVGPFTVCNLNGQKLELVNQTEVDSQLACLGPDAMAVPFPEMEISESLRSVEMPVSEALLKQSVIAGVGNIAKSESLHVAGIDPRTNTADLDNATMVCLLEAIRSVLWNSYNKGGRWDCRVYRRKGKPCSICRSTIRSMRLSPSKRTTYFCRKCQGTMK